jgi:hypothetical protein
MLWRRQPLPLLAPSPVGLQERVDGRQARWSCATSRGRGASEGMGDGGGGTATKRTPQPQDGRPAISHDKITKLYMSEIE